MDYLIGLDVGTTAVKAGVFDALGRLVGAAHREYELLTPGPDLVELPAGAYWEAAVEAIREAIGKSAVAAEAIRGLAISSQGETLIPVAADGSPLRNAIVWLDNRSHTEARALEERFGCERVYEITGQNEVVPTWPATKILWLREREPDVFRAAAKFLLLEDYLMYRLTGEFATEHSMVSSTIYFDIRSREWWPEMLDALGISPDRLPRLFRSGEPVGKLTSEAAKALCLTENVIVGAGALDQMAGAVGAGNVADGQVTETTGAALAICATGQPVYDPLRRMPVHCHAVPGLFALLPWCQTAGMALRWFRDVFGAGEMAEAERTGTDAYDVLCRLAESVPPGSDGLIMLPHLAGACCPEMVPQAQGVFFGFTLRHGKGHFVRATMESVAFMLRRNLDNLAELGVETRELISVGGASKSPLWRQIKADTLGRPLYAMPDLEAACLGAALLAGVACGMYEDVASASRAVKRERIECQPDLESSQALQATYRRYIDLFDALRPMFA